MRFVRKLFGDLRLCLKQIASNDIVEKKIMHVKTINDVIRASFGSILFTVIDL